MNVLNAEHQNDIHSRRLLVWKSTVETEQFLKSVQS